MDPCARVGDLTVASSLVPLLECHGLTSLESLMSYADGERLDKGGLPAWRERLRLELTDGRGETKTFYLKRYRQPPWSAQLDRVRAGAAGHGTAWIEWRWMRKLHAAGVGCVQPGAFGESMAGRRERASALLTPAVAGESLERWAAGRRGRCPRAMVVQLADSVRRFHGLGLVHRDLYLSHVFHDESESEDQRYRLIDLHRVMHPRWWRTRWRVKDLAALNYSTPTRVATAADRVRFLRRYLGVRRLGRRGKALARRVSAKTKRIARHDCRRTALVAGAGTTVG